MKSHLTLTEWYMWVTIEGDGMLGHTRAFVWQHNHIGKKLEALFNHIQKASYRPMWAG